MKRVIIFRGLMGFIFSLGMDALKKKIKKQHPKVKASVHPWTMRAGKQKKLIKEFKAGKWDEFVIAGHSLGGNSANWLTWNLVQAGIPPEKIMTFTFDPTDPKPNPKGVLCLNYVSDDFRAKHVEGARNIVREDLNHLEIDDEHDLVLQTLRDHW